MILFIVLYIFSIPILWILYLAVMCFLTVKDSVPKFSYRAGTVLLYTGLFWDVLVNVFVVSFIFLELPREYTVSQRLQRLVKTTGWKSSLAKWFAINLLNPFSGKIPHIKLD